MSFDIFRTKVNALIQKAGGGISVRFANDTEKGRFSAHCSDGTTITSNPSSHKITVLFGSGHQAMAEV